MRNYQWIFLGKYYSMVRLVFMKLYIAKTCDAWILFLKPTRVKYIEDKP